PHNKNRQPGDHHWASPKTVGSHAQGNLQHCLGQPISPQRNPDTDTVSPPGMLCASTANTGVNRNNPNIRVANSKARRMLALRSVGVRTKRCFLGRLVPAFTSAELIKLSLLAQKHLGTLVHIYQPCALY